MELTILAFWGLIPLLLIFMAEHYGRKELGVIAGLLVIILALMVFLTGVQIVTGTTTVGGCNTMIPFFG